MQHLSAIQHLHLPIVTVFKDTTEWHMTLDRARSSADADLQQPAGIVQTAPAQGALAWGRRPYVRGQGTEVANIVGTS